MQRLDRFSYDPILDEAGNPVEFKINKGDIARAIALSPYDTLTADYVAALTGGTEEAVTNRFGTYKRSPTRWVDICPAQLAQPEEYRNNFLIYLNSDKAQKFLEERYLAKPSHGCNGPTKHRLMASQMRASFDIAEREGNGTVTTFQDMLARPETPDETRTDNKKRDRRHQIQVTYTKKGVERSVWVQPDAYPFLFRNTKDREAIIFLEADRNTKSISADDEEHHDLDQQLIQYIELFLQRLISKRYGVRYAYVVIATDNRTHLKNIMGNLERLTESCPQLRQYFLFTFHPSYHSVERPSATGHMVTNPYLRAGGLPDFSLLTGEEVPNGYREIKGPDRRTRANRRADSGSGERSKEGAAAT